MFMNANRNPTGSPASFRDRTEAGRILAGMLEKYADRSDVLVLGLPRGGVPVAYEVCRALHAPLDVLLVRKLGVPGQRELAMGAIASGGVRVLNQDVVISLGVSVAEIEEVTARETRELSRRERAYRNGRPAPEVRGRTVILVDDGLATGSSMRAAVAAIRARHPGSIVVAVPVGARSTCEEMRSEADDVVCVRMPSQFYAVGMWYRDFSEVADEDITELLDQAATEHKSDRNVSLRR